MEEDALDVLDSLIVAAHRSILGNRIQACMDIIRCCQPFALSIDPSSGQSRFDSYHRASQFVHLHVYTTISFSAACSQKCLVPQKSHKNFPNSAVEHACVLPLQSTGRPHLPASSFSFCMSGQARGTRNFRASWQMHATRFWWTHLQLCCRAASLLCTTPTSLVLSLQGMPC